MQWSFDFDGKADLQTMRHRLRAAYGPVRDWQRQPPVGQLVKSMIGSLTRDAVSERAYRLLRYSFPRWSDLVAIESATLAATIGEVAFARDKAVNVRRTLGVIAATRPDFNLTFLGEQPVPDALAWLQRLPGVGLKVAAETLNLSTLRRPVFVASGHVLRVLGRFGLIEAKATSQRAYATVMALAGQWSDMEFVELHAWLKVLGQGICHPAAPDCAVCPLRSACQSARQPARKSEPRRPSVGIAAHHAR